MTKKNNSNIYEADFGEDKKKNNRRTIKKSTTDDNKNETLDIHKNKFEAQSDEAVVIQAQGPDSDALEYILSKYKNFVRTKAQSYFLIGADREDIIQEGMIGLYKAIRDFREEKQVSFRAFAELCITRQIITAIKSATRQKHQPLNSYISLNKPVYDDESERTLIDVLSGTKITNPEDIIINQENFHKIELMMDEILSPFELKVLKLYFEGKKYIEIADELDRDVKSIDNAIQRIKTKVVKHISKKDQ